MKLLTILLVLQTVTACTFTYGFERQPTDTPGDAPIGVPGGEQAQVVNVIDGDTIDVQLNGQTVRIRYIGVNTPERDEVCYGDATRANADLVSGKTVTLIKDQSETDRFGRLLRYIYVGNVFVNEQLVEQGYAEVVSYPPDTAQYDYFRRLEDAARSANRGCHPTGIFDDGSFTR